MVWSFLSSASLSSSDSMTPFPKSDPNWTPLHVYQNLSPPQNSLGFSFEKTQPFWWHFWASHATHTLPTRSLGLQVGEWNADPNPVGRTTHKFVRQAAGPEKKGDLLHTHWFYGIVLQRSKRRFTCDMIGLKSWQLLYLRFVPPPQAPGPKGKDSIFLTSFLGCQKLFDQQLDIGLCFTWISSSWDFFWRNSPSIAENPKSSFSSFPSPPASPKRSISIKKNTTQPKKTSAISVISCCFFFFRWVDCILFVKVGLQSSGGYNMQL